MTSNDFKSRDDDIFIVAYPKSGSTVLQMMLYQMSGTGSMDIPHIDLVVPWFDRWIGRGLSAGLNLMPSPRSFKSHQPLRDLPETGRYIYIVRNPKDVCVSAYHHEVLLHDLAIPIQNYVKRFANGSDALGSWFDHVESSLPHRQEKRVLLLRYEELCSDLATTVDRVSAFCGFAIEGSKRGQVIERCSIRYMKAFESKFDPRTQVQATNPQSRKQEGHFIRRGGTGNWMEELSGPEAELIDREFSKRLKKLRRNVTEADFEFLQRYA